MLAYSSMSNFLMQRSTVVTDNIGLHEGDEVIHRGINTLLHPGHCQVAAIEIAMDAGKSVLIKICLKKGV